MKRSNCRGKILPNGTRSHVRALILCRVKKLPGHAWASFFRGRTRIDNFVPSGNRFRKNNETNKFREWLENQILLPINMSQLANVAYLRQHFHFTIELKIGDCKTRWLTVSTEKQCYFHLYYNVCTLKRSIVTAAKCDLIFYSIILFFKSYLCFVA